MPIRFDPRYKKFPGDVRLAGTKEKVEEEKTEEVKEEEIDVEKEE